MAAFWLSVVLIFISITCLYIVYPNQQVGTLKHSTFYAVLGVAMGAVSKLIVGMFS